MNHWPNYFLVNVMTYNSIFVCLAHLCGVKHVSPLMQSNDAAVRCLSTVTVTALSRFLVTLVGHRRPHPTLPLLVSHVSSCCACGSGNE